MDGALRREGQTDAVGEDRASLRAEPSISPLELEARLHRGSEPPAGTLRLPAL